jgi:phenylacetate-CoA ligase
MKFDFSDLPLANRGYADRPMMFLDGETSASLTAVLELAMIETGARAAWERWQKAQLRNLLRHATQRSAFWRDRMQMRTPDSELSSLPILTRADVRRQVQLEGSLLRDSDGYGSSEHSTSGSSGTPVRFFVSEMNSRYNSLRALTYFFSEGKDLSLNYTAVRAAKPEKFSEIARTRGKFVVEKQPTWLGGLGSLINGGSHKIIDHLDFDARALIKELRKDSVGYLMLNPRNLAVLLSQHDVELLNELDVRECLFYAEGADPALVQAVRDLGIHVRSSYSSEEVGQIAFECARCPGHYHVTTSNVMVEVVDVSHDVGGTKLGRVLVTHLHSYATPFMRYELGDLALLYDSCPCGHDGPTLHNVLGRATSALKHRNGSLTPFMIHGDRFQEVVQFSEFRIRQVEIDKIVVEFGGRTELSPEEVQNATQYLRAWAGDEFKIDVIARPSIDWGESIKRQSFRCEV